MTEELKDITDFFDFIGLPYKLTTVRKDSFMKGIDIQNGVLLIDVETLPYVGDALHEAGHIAVTEESIRSQLQGDVAKCGHGPADEMAAIAWSWAALSHIGLKPEVVFHEEGYKKGSQSIIESFTHSGGFGTPLLVFWGMCLNPEDNNNGFPKMTHWLRPADNP